MKKSLSTRHPRPVHPPSAKGQDGAPDASAHLHPDTSRGPAPQPLRGRTLAVLCDGEECESLGELRVAADALGAKVVHLRPRASQLTRPEQIDAMGRMLGRLYDAIECHALPPAIVQRIRAVADKPVCCGDECTSARGAADRPDRLQAWMLAMMSP